MRELLIEQDLVR